MRLSDLFLRVLPVLVWLGAVACVVGLFHHRTAQFELVGIADAEVHDVGTNTRARLISVSVQLFKKVNKGEPVAVVNTVPDDERLDAEIAVIQAEINHLDAQLTELRKNYEALVFNQQAEWWAERRAFTADVVVAKTRIVDTNEVLENDQATLKEMQQGIEIFTIENAADLGTDIALYNQLQKMKANRDRQMEKIEREKGGLAKYQKELKDAEIREEKYITYYPRTNICYLRPSNLFRLAAFDNFYLFLGRKMTHQIFADIGNDRTGPFFCYAEYRKIRQYTYLTNLVVNAADKTVAGSR